MIQRTGKIAWKKLDLNQKVECPVHHIMTPLGADNFVLAEEWVNQIVGTNFWTILETTDADLMPIPDPIEPEEFIKVDAEPIKEEKPKRKKKNVRSSESKKEAEEE